MNVIEALAKWKQLRKHYCMPAFPQTIVDTLAAEVERLRAELAAAKAASVPPAKFWWCYESNECDILIHGMNDEDSTLLGNWLDDRMKERGE